MVCLFLGFGYLCLYWFANTPLVSFFQGVLTPYTRSIVFHLVLRKLCMASVIPGSGNLSTPNGLPAPLFHVVNSASFEWRK